MEESTMPKTKGESIFFTAITAWMMVYVMTLYNIAIAMGSFTNAAFLIALKEMWIEYIIIALLAYFVSDHLINHIHQDQIVLSRGCLFHDFNGCLTVVRSLDHKSCVLQNSLGNCHTEPSSLDSADGRSLFS